MKKPIQVVVIEPQKDPVIRTIDSSLEGMQGIVGGLIEVLPLGNKMLLVINEEGKLENLPPNFWTADKSDVVVGTAFVCKERGPNMVGLSDDEAKQMVHLFQTRVRRCLPDEEINLDDYMQIKISFGGDNK